MRVQILRTHAPMLLLAAFALVVGSAKVARAQDVFDASQPAAADTPPPAPTYQERSEARETRVDSATSGLRLAIQGRINVQSALENGIVGTARPVVPTATVGVRLLDQRLFLGLGLGFGALSTSNCGNMGCDADKTTRSQSYFSLSPLATFDLLREEFGALYLAGWFNFLSYSAVHVEHTGDPAVETGGGSGVGLNLALGLRGFITRGVSLGTEWGWGFVSATDDGDRTGDPDDTSTFVHGIFGTVVVEGSIGL